MTTAAIIQAVLQFGPTIVPLLAKLAADIRAGKAQQEPSQADWDELTRLAGLSSSSIYAGLGIDLPTATEPKPSTT